MNDFMKYEGQETAAATCANGQGNLPACAPLANPYVPFQLQNPERYKPGCAIIRGTLFPGLDLPLAGQENTQELRQTALHTLQELGFAINELGLYLDTHRSDSDAVELYNQYVELYGHHGADADGVCNERHLQLARRSVAVGLRAGGLSHVCV